jgi:hypothetical protein
MYDDNQLIVDQSVPRRKVTWLNREEARLMSRKEGLSSGMMTEWGESSSRAAVGSDNNTVDTAAYVQKYTKITSTQLSFLCRRLLLLITWPFTIPPFLQTLLCPQLLDAISESHSNLTHFRFFTIEVDGISDHQVYIGLPTFGRFVLICI